MLLRLVKRRFDQVPAGLPERITALTSAQRGELSEALFDFNTPADLEAWLRERPAPKDRLPAPATPHRPRPSPPAKPSTAARGCSHSNPCALWERHPCRDGLGRDVGTASRPAAAPSARAPHQQRPTSPAGDTQALGHFQAT
ncbi:hypothetical protein CKO31_16690 [Thiohalocapsa halophila]|uniref:DUF4351 domain-containing protein n=1 Tax=Thiohalocapsa halophila TaxID=69359 RepID=A0ABS1CK86_9GAMM|nr:hypothetical protein [Thiohalocapsa halophila]